MQPPKTRVESELQSTLHSRGKCLQSAESFCVCERFQNQTRRCVIRDPRAEGDRSRRNSIAMSIMSYNGAAIIGTAGSREIRRAAVPFSGTIEPAHARRLGSEDALARI